MTTPMSAAEAHTEWQRTLDSAGSAATLLRPAVLAVHAFHDTPASADRDRLIAEATQRANDLLANLGDTLETRADAIQTAAKHAGAPAARNTNVTDRVAVYLRAVANRFPSTQDSAETALAHAADCTAWLYDVMVAVTATLAADKVESTLDGISTGKPVDLGDYVNHLDEADRAEALRILNRDLDGAWVDVTSQKAYKLPVGLDRRARMVLLALPVVLVVAAAWVAGQFIVPDGWPLDSPREMLLALGLVATGWLVHFLANGFKDRSLDTWRQNVMVISDWSAYWLLHPLRAGWLLAPAIITLGLLAVLKTDPSGEGVAVFLLAGYSADSLARSAIGQLDELAQKSAKTLLPDKQAPAV